MSVLMFAAAPWARAESAPALGAKLFQEKGCSHCHVMNGIGDARGPDLSAVGKRLKKPAIEKQILEGGMNMPAFSDALSPAETRDLVEYLHQCKHGLAATQSGAR